MPTEERRKRNPKVAINPDLLRRGRSRGLAIDEIGLTSTPKSTSEERGKARRIVTFSPKPQIIPQLIPILEEIEEINKASTSQQTTIQNQIPKQIIRTDNSSSDSGTDENVNLYKTAIDQRSNRTSPSTSSSFDLNESDNRFKQIISNNPPFESTFAQKISFGVIPGEIEDDYFLTQLFHLSSESSESESETETKTETETETEMALYKLTEIIPVIPSYDGKEELLKLYIRSAKHYYNGVAENERQPILDILLSRLTGKAAEALGNVDEINTIDIMIERLNDKIPEALSYTLAHTQLQGIIQRGNESVNDYAKRFEETLNKLKRAATQAGGGMDITEAIGKTLFIQNMTNENMRLVAASSNAATAKDIIKYVKERELILNARPTRQMIGGICGFCSKPNHAEAECSKRKYAQKLLKITPNESRNSHSDSRNNGNRNRNNFGESFRNDRRFNGNRSFGNNNPQGFRHNNGNGGNNNGSGNGDGNSNNYRNNGNGYQGRNENGNNNYRNRNGGNNSERGGSYNFGNANNNRGTNNGGNNNRGNFRNNNHTNDNQRTTLNSQNEPIQAEDNVQISLRELQTHAQFHATNSEN